MNNPERLPAETHKPFTGYLWGALAVLTCPCHLPILACRAGRHDRRRFHRGALGYCSPRADRLVRPVL
jgi:hypothetical protein